MANIFRMAVFIVAVFVSGALIAPALWWLVHSIPDPGTPGWMRDLSRQPFHRYLHRAILIVAVTGIWPFARWLGCESLRDIGYHDPRGALTRWLWGVTAGGAMFGLALVMEFTLGERVWRTDLTFMKLASAAMGAVVTAVAAGFVEETIFRGVVCGRLRLTLGWPTAIGISSLAYSWLHFLGKPGDPPSISWLSGFDALGGMLAGLVGGASLLPGLPTLFLAGTILGWIYCRTGSLYAPLGLHAGWIFWVKMRGALTSAGTSPGAGLGESRISAGWTGLVIVALATIILAGWEFRRRRVRLSPPEEKRTSLPSSQ